MQKEHLKHKDIKRLKIKGWKAMRVKYKTVKRKWHILISDKKDKTF